MLENSSNSKNLRGGVGIARQSHHNAPKFFEFEVFGGRGGVVDRAMIKLENS